MQDVMQAQGILCAKAPLNLGGLLQLFVDSALPSSGNAEFFFLKKINTKKRNQ